MKRFTFILVFVTIFTVSLNAKHEIPVTLSCGEIILIDTENFPNVEDLTQYVLIKDAERCSGKDIEDDLEEPGIPDPEPNPSDV